jgi:putative addiction module component (TIGR02574 family)
MTMTLQELEREVRDLTPNERARLAAHLLVTLDVGGDDDVENSWEAEIGERLAAYRRGDLSTVPASEVMSEARKRIR